MIEFDEDLGIAKDQQVEVQVRVIPHSPRMSGDGFLRIEGALADDDEWDDIMEEIDNARKNKRRP